VGVGVSAVVEVGVGDVDVWVAVGGGVVGVGVGVSEGLGDALGGRKLPEKTIDNPIRRSAKTKMAAATYCFLMLKTSIYLQVYISNA